MNDDYIVTVFVLVENMLKVMNCQTDARSHVSHAEIITVAIVIPVLYLFVGIPAQSGVKKCMENRILGIVPVRKPAILAFNCI